MNQNILISVVTVVLSIFNLTSSAQSDNYISYYRNVEEAYQKGIFTSNNDSTIFYMSAAFSNVEKPFAEDFFVMAKAYLGLKNNEKYFEFLLKSIESGIDSSELNKINAYLSLNVEQKNRCITAYNNFKISIDTALYQKLDSLCLKDQKVRNELDAYTTESEAHKHIVFQDSLNRESILSMIETKGFPGRKLIGTDGKSFILLVHIPPSWIKDNFELLKTQIIKGNLNPSSLAAVIDRHSYHSDNHEIIYNSFLPQNIIAKPNGEKLRKENRWVIGALSNKVFFDRYYKIREWKPKNL